MAKPPLSILFELRYPTRWYTKLGMAILALMFFAVLATASVAGFLVYRIVKPQRTSSEINLQSFPGRPDAVKTTNNPGRCHLHAVNRIAGEGTDVRGTRAERGALPAVRRSQLGSRVAGGAGAADVDGTAAYGGADRLAEAICARR